MRSQNKALKNSASKLEGKIMKSRGMKTRKLTSNKKNIDYKTTCGNIAKSNPHGNIFPKLLMNEIHTQNSLDT